MESYILFSIFVLALVIFYFIGFRIGKALFSKNNDNIVLIDTSALIDGRILELAKIGFLSGRYIVFRFVLSELQNIADSSNSLRRSKGRRGLNVLKQLQKESGVFIEILDQDIKEVRDVDQKLLKMAKMKNAKLFTVDYNLSEVADVEGIQVLNVNELSNSIKPLHLPGEQFNIKIIQKGKERNQGVGYLEDGTMIIIENSGRNIGKTIKVRVKKIIQTDAGRIVFATPANNRSFLPKFFNRSKGK